MTIIKMSDGMIVNTKNARIIWEQAQDYDGKHLIGRCTRSNSAEQTLMKSRRGRYYVVRSHGPRDNQSSAEWVSHEEAVRWLTLNDYDVPEDLEDLLEKLTD